MPTCPAGLSVGPSGTAWPWVGFRPQAVRRWVGYNNLAQHHWPVVHPSPWCVTNWSKTDRNLPVVRESCTITISSTPYKWVYERSATYRRATTAWPLYRLASTAWPLYRLASTAGPLHHWATLLPNLSTTGPLYHLATLPPGPSTARSHFP